MMDFVYNSKLLFRIILAFAILTILDGITALFILPYEANPLYLLTGSMFLIWMLKIGLVIFLFYIYFRNLYEKKILYFSFIYILLLGILLSAIGIFSNVNGMLNDDVIEYNENLEPHEKASAYYDVVFFIMILPYIFGVIAFSIFERTQNRVRFEKWE